MTDKLSHNIWLHAACAPDKAQIKEQLTAAVRYLARRAAEEDYWRDAEATRAGCKPIERKDFDP